MAKEFDVPFMGSVPIDPMFIRLIEEGRRPVYPQGTVVEGQDMAKSNDAEVNEDDGVLVEKYTACSLYPIFDGMTKTLVTRIEG